MDIVAWDCTRPDYPNEFMRSGITSEQIIAITHDSFTKHLNDFVRAALSAMNKHETQVDVSFSFADEIGPVPFEGTLDTETWNWSMGFISKGDCDVDVYFAVSDMQAECDTAARMEEWKAFAQKRKQKQSALKSHPPDQHDQEMTDVQ